MTEKPNQEVISGKLITKVNRNGTEMDLVIYLNKEQAENIGGYYEETYEEKTD